MTTFPTFKREAIISAMKKVFTTDQKRINHALKVLAFAENLLEKEQAGREVVVAAAILHDIGIHQAEKKYGSSAGYYQEKEGPPIAAGILRELGASEPFVEEVCEIIGHHHSPGKVKTINFQVLYDADWLVNLKEEHDVNDREKLTKLINKVFLTESGKALATELYLKS